MLFRSDKGSCAMGKFSGFWNGDPEKRAKMQMEKNQQSTPNTSPQSPPSATKRCRYCTSEIPRHAKRCPQCAGDLRRWFARHPVWTFLLVVFIGIPFLGGVLSAFDNGGNAKQSHSSLPTSKAAAIPAEKEKPMVETPSPKTPVASTPDITESLEYKLASINAGHKVDTDNPTIAQFKTYLDGIVTNTGDTPNEVSDALVFTWQKIDDAGRPDTLMDVAAGVHQVALAGGGISVNEICAAMLTIMGV